MALYYNNANVSSSANVFFNNQAAQNVYHNNALVWQHAAGYYPGTSPQPKQVNTGSYGAFYSYVEGNTVNVNGTAVYIPVDLTGVRSLVLTGSISGTGFGMAGWWLSTAGQFGNGIWNYPYYFLYAPDSSLYLYRVDGKGTTTVTWDVSGYSGTHYLGLGTYFNSTGEWSTARAQIDTAIGYY